MVTVDSVEQTAWGGKVIVSREFYNPRTRDYLCLEGHEVGADQGLDVPAGHFMTARWVPDGNNGSGGAPTELGQLIRWMLDYPIPEGMVEQCIPGDAWC